MRFHEIIAIGPIYIHKVATKPVWSINDLARFIYTLDNDQVLVGGGAGVGDWFTLCDLETAQTITGVKTFDTLPILTDDPTEDDHPVKKSYLVTYAAETYVDMISDQLSIGGKKGFLSNPLVSGAPLVDLEVANKGYVDDNFVALVGNQTVDGIKTFLDIPVGPNSNPTSDNQLARKRYVDDQVATAGGNQVKVSSTDSTASYLASKLVAGSGCTLTTVGASGTNQTLRISLTPSATGAADGEIFVSGADTTPGYLAAKLVAGEGITLTVGNPSGDEYVSIAYSGGNDRYVTYDFTYNVGAAEVGDTLTMPAPDAAKAANISRNTSNYICWSAYDHPVNDAGSWTLTPTEDLVVKTRWTGIFPYGWYRSGWRLYFPTLQYLAQTLTWKTYKNCTDYNSGSPNGSLVDWDFFPLMDDYIYVPYDDSAQTWSGGIWTPGFNMIIHHYYLQKSFGSNYDDGDWSSCASPSVNADWISFVDTPRWVLGCTPAPDIETDVQKYFYAKDKTGVKTKQYLLNYYSYGAWADYEDSYLNSNYAALASWDPGSTSNAIDGDARYVVLKAGTSYTMKLRSIFGRKDYCLYGYGSASNMWYHSYYGIGNGYRPTSPGGYYLNDIWGMYQGAGTTEVRLKAIAKSSLNLI